LALPSHSRVDNKDKHVEYLHMLEVPTAARMEEIAEKQEKNEELSRAAAGVIQVGIILKSSPVIQSIMLHVHDVT
jgi:hypothetical protein